MTVITLTTDFGAGGRYVAQMKGVLYSRLPGVTVADLTHDLPPQDVATAVRFLERVTPWWPAGAVHLAVIDPGVGTERPIVAVEALGQRFVGPDNGLFGWLADRSPTAVVLDPARLDVAGDSATFHGRDLMAPAAARLAGGAAVTDLGTPCVSLKTLPADEPPAAEGDAQAGRLKGRVVEVDHYGNLITNIPVEMLGDAPRDARLRTTLSEHETFGLWRTYGENAPQTLVALVGSMGEVELAIVNGDAARMLGAAVGDPVTLEWGAHELSESSGEDSK